MKIYIPNRQDYDLIHKLLIITKSIESLYKKMCELELNGKKNTKEYNGLITLLKETVEEENKIYSDANINEERGVGLTFYIMEQNLPENTENDVESTINQNYNVRTYRRIINNLFNIGVSDYKSAKLRNAFEKDIINGYLSFMQDFANSKSYEEKKDQFIINKYNTAFINKSIESDMLSSSFDIPKTFYVSSRLIADVYNVNLTFYKSISNDFYAKEAAKQISRLIDIFDEEYKYDDDNKLSSILRQCYLRSAFLFLDDELLTDMNDSFHEFVESDEYLDKHSNDTIGTQLVINCFKSIKKDRNKPAILSLGFRKQKN